MKKFQNLGTSLSREQLKKIKGGDECLDCGGDGKPCGGAGIGSVCSVSCGGHTYMQACCGGCSVTDNIIYCDGRMYYNC